MEWVKNNKEWLFSGIGLAVLLMIGRVIYKGRQSGSDQKICSGSNSTNIQAGHDIKIGAESKQNGREEKK